jgi:hypothetical protein
MDPESKKLLEQTLELEQDNNKILRSMKRSMIWGRIMNVIYWVIIIGISVGAFYFIQPYFNKVLNLYNSISGSQQKVNTTNTSVQDLLKKL